MMNNIESLKSSLFYTQLNQPIKSVLDNFLNLLILIQYNNFEVYDNEDNCYVSFCKSCKNADFILVDREIIIYDKDTKLMIPLNIQDDKKYLVEFFNSIINKIEDKCSCIKIRVELN